MTCGIESAPTQYWLDLVLEILLYRVPFVLYRTLMGFGAEQSSKLLMVHASGGGFYSLPKVKGTYI